MLFAKHPQCRLKLKLADQDVLNIVGSQAPWLFQPLPCQWNYHTWTVDSFLTCFPQMTTSHMIMFLGASDGPNESVSSDADGMPPEKFYPDTI